MPIFLLSAFLSDHNRSFPQPKPLWSSSGVGPPSPNEKALLSLTGLFRWGSEWVMGRNLSGSLL